MLFVVTTLNYADRATLSITDADPQGVRHRSGDDGLHLLGVQLGVRARATAERLAARPLRAAVCGQHLPVVGVHAAVSTIGLGGSAAFAVAALFAMRFAVGIAEAPAFPANAKVVASLVPTAERGTVGDLQRRAVLRPWCSRR